MNNQTSRKKDKRAKSNNSKAFVILKNDLITKKINELNIYLKKRHKSSKKYSVDDDYAASKLMYDMQKWLNTYWKG